jgi:hypothetical protein
MEEKAKTFLDKHYTRIKPNHEIKKNGRKPALSIFYILYPKSQNGMAKVTIFYNGGGKIEFMENDEIKTKDPNLIYYVQGAFMVDQDDKHASPVWYRKFSILGNSALTKKLGGRKSRVKRIYKS